MGSVNWFEEKFIDELFQGKGLETNEVYEINTLNEISALTNDVFNYLIRDTGVSLYDIDFTTPATASASIDNAFINQSDEYKSTRYESYGNLFTKLIHYDNTSYNTDTTSYLVEGNNDQYSIDLLPDANNVPTGIRRLLCGSRAINDNPANVPWLRENGSWQGGVAPANMFTHRFAFWHDKNIQDFKSLLFSFNQLLALYLRTAADNITNKVYVELIGPFANSISSSAVFSPHGNTFPDLTFATNRSAPMVIPPFANYRFGRRGDPIPSKIICTSLAYIMQRMISDVNPKNQNYDYLLNSLTEVPVYMKDRYKNGLCYISKLLRTLISKCDFYKDIIQKTKINLDRTDQRLRNTSIIANRLQPLVYIPTAGLLAGNDLDPTGAAFATNPILAKTNNPNALRYENGDSSSIQDLTGKLLSVEVKERLSEIISSIGEYTFSLVSTAESVQRDFSSDITYFETYNNFINNYKSRYDRNPLMPLSHMLYFVRDLDNIYSWQPYNVGGTLYNCTFRQDTIFTPDKLVGTTEFKLQYGMRSIILNNKVNMINYPSISEQIRKYNETSITSNAIELDHYERFMQKIISIIKYNLECRNFKSYVQSDTCSTLFYNRLGITLKSNYCNLMGRDDSGYTPDLDNQVYAYGKDRRSTNIIFSIESSNQDDEINKMITFNKINNKEEVTRMTECINNLVDLNILPINLNVLMKDIPLVNLYNYDYTFELMSAKLYGKNAKDFRSKTDVIGKIKDTQDAFLSLIYHPYIELTPSKMWLGSANVLSESYEFISRIMRGDNSLGLSRPKFLSDQLFNKILLRSVYPSISSYDESGASGSISTWRGQYGYDGSLNISQPRPGMVNQRTDRSWLTYPFIDEQGNFTIHHREFTKEMMLTMENIGRLRFDSSIVRNLFFIVNVLRITRLKLNRELTSSRSVVVNSHYAVNPNVTEYGVDPFNTNEIYPSKTMDNQNRFNVMDTM